MLLEFLRGPAGKDGKRGPKGYCGSPGKDLLLDKDMARYLYCLGGLSLKYKLKDDDLEFFKNKIEHYYNFYKEDKNEN